MARMGAFGKVLTTVRKDAGYPSSRSFFNKNGGTAFFGCTYRHYLNVESGKAVPGVKLIEKIAAALGLLTDRNRARRFILGYLTAFTGSEDMVNLITYALSGPPANLSKVKSQLVESMARVNQQHVFDLSREQSEWTCRSAENYWTWTVLAHDADAWEAKGIAEATGFDSKKIAKALRELVVLKLVEKDGPGFRCPHAGKVFQHPESRVYPVGLKATRGYRDEMAKKRGDTLMRYFFFSRGPETALRQYFDYLIKSVQGAEIVSSTSKADDSVFFEIETQVRRILPF